MAADQTRTVDGDAPDDSADLLPEESILTLDEYWLWRSRSNWLLANSVGTGRAVRAAYRARV